MNSLLETTWEDFDIKEYAEEMAEAHKESFLCGRTSSAPHLDSIDGLVDDWPKVLNRFKEGEKTSADILGWPCGLVITRDKCFSQILEFIEWHAEFHRARKYIIRNFSEGVFKTYNSVDKINEAVEK